MKALNTRQGAGHPAPSLSYGGLSNDGGHRCFSRVEQPHRKRAKLATVPFCANGQTPYRQRNQLAQSPCDAGKRAWVDTSFVARMSPLSELSHLGDP